MLKRKGTYQDRKQPPKKFRRPNAPRRKTVKPESKTFDLAYATYNADDNTASITSIFQPVRGTDIIDRVGTKVRVTSINVKGEVGSDNAMTDAPTVATANAFTARLSIILDRQPNGALPTITQIYSNVNNVSNLNLANRDRFKVLYTEDFEFDAYVVGTNAASCSNSIRKFKMYKKVNIPVFFNSGTAGTIADLSSNSILMVWQSTFGNAATGSMAANVITRCRFEDP